MQTPFWIPITASIIGALVGAFLGFVWQTKRDKKANKKNVLAVLMAHRAVGSYELEWIKALNVIDVYFYDNKAVRELCHKYFAYTKPPYFEKGQHVDVLFQLIVEMAKDIGYTDLKHSDINDFYAPEALKTHYPQGPYNSEPEKP